MLIVMDKYSLEEQLSQPLQANDKQYKTSVTFLVGYKDTFNVTNKNKKFYFTVSIKDDDLNQKTIPIRASGIENLNCEMKRVFFMKVLLQKLHIRLPSNQISQP